MSNVSKVFISHAVKDKVLVDALVDLLQTGAGVPDDLVFASSIEGLGNRYGKNFVNGIRAELNDAALTVQLITPAFWESAFCLCELGATWASDAETFPLLVEPLDYADLAAVMEGQHVGKIHRSQSLDDLRDAVQDALGVKSRTARWGVKRQQFLDRLPSLVDEIPGRSVVPVGELETLRGDLRESGRAIETLEEELEKLRQQNQQLRRAKDPVEVAMITRSDDDVAAFEEVVHDLEDAFDDLPRVVAKALFMIHSGHQYGGYIPDVDDRADAREAAADRYLEEDDDGPAFYLRESEPKVAKALSLAKILFDYEPSETLEEWFLQTHQLEFDTQNRRVWQALGLL